MIRMRMVEPEELGAKFRRASFRRNVVLRTNKKTPPRPLVGRIRERQRRRDHTVAPIQGAAAFVRIRLGAVRTNRMLNTWLKR